MLLTIAPANTCRDGQPLALLVWSHQGESGFGRHPATRVPLYSVWLLRRSSDQILDGCEVWCTGRQEGTQVPVVDVEALLHPGVFVHVQVVSYGHDRRGERLAAGRGHGSRGNRVCPLLSFDVLLGHRTAGRIRPAGSGPTRRRERRRPRMTGVCPRLTHGGAAGGVSEKSASSSKHSPPERRQVVLPGTRSPAPAGHCLHFALRCGGPEDDPAVLVPRVRDGHSLVS
jgi:hypothetical protein